MTTDHPTSTNSPIDPAQVDEHSLTAVLTELRVAAHRQRVDFEAADAAAEKRFAEAQLDEAKLRATGVLDPNTRRADRMRAYLQLYADAEHVDLESALADLLADAQHVALANGFDFNLALRRGTEHFEAETEADGAE